MGIIQDTIRRYLDKGYVKRVIIMGLDHSGKTTTMKGLINDYSYVKMIPGECSQLHDEAFAYYQLYDRFEPLDGYIYGRYNTGVETETRYTDNYTKYYFGETLKRIEKDYSNPLFIVYLHDMFMDEQSKLEHKEVLENRTTILNRYLKVIKYYSKYYPFIVVTERSFRLLGKGAVHGYK